MNWEAVGAIGEVGGAVAVVATLIYLAGQIRQSTQATRFQVDHAVRRDWTDIRFSYLHHPELSKLFRRGMLEYESLDEDERQQFFLAVSNLIEHYDDCYRWHLQGLYDWNAMEGDLVDYFGQPGILAWWAVRGPRLSPAFRDYVENTIRPQTGGSRLPYWTGWTEERPDSG